jgi:hypothetical protein
MKTTTSQKWKSTRSSLFSTFGHSRQFANDAGLEKCFKGTVVSIDPADQLLRVKNWLTVQKAFNLGTNCLYVEPGRENTTPAMLRPGEIVEVNYQDNHGVLIADRVEQIPIQMIGIVTALNPASRRLTLKHTPVNRQFLIPEDCQIVLRDGKAGALDEIKIGHRVTVTYEMPEDQPTARKLAQTSLEFAGELTAMDLEDRTVKVKFMFSSRKFHVASDCAVVIHGQPDRGLKDLRLGDQVVCSYEEMDGVAVADRIAPLVMPPNNPPINFAMPGF